MATLAASAVLAQPAHGVKPLPIEFDPPGTTDRVATSCLFNGYGCGSVGVGINKSGTITGYFTDRHALYHGYLRTPDGGFVVFDVPGSENAPTVPWAPWAINDAGAVAGFFEDASGVFHGFTRSAAGQYVTLDVPGAGTAADQGTVAVGLNNAGEVLGYIVDATYGTHGFVQSADGQVAVFDPPTEAGQTNPCFTTCLNKHGQATGGFRDSNGQHGFLRQRNGQITQLDVPGSGALSGTTSAVSIDDNGLITGTYSDTAFVTRGFVRTPDGAYVTFDAPKSNTAGTNPAAINAFGAIAGYTEDFHGFERFNDGSVETFVAANAVGTFPTANNNKSVVTGRYDDRRGLYHGFVWTP